MHVSDYRLQKQKKSTLVDFKHAGFSSRLLKKSWSVSSLAQPQFYHAARLTCCGAVVSDVAGHVDGFAVDGEVSHAAHKVSVPDREVLR